MQTLDVFMCYFIFNVTLGEKYQKVDFKHKDIKGLEEGVLSKLL